MLKNFGSFASQIFFQKQRQLNVLIDDIKQTKDYYLEAFNKARLDSAVHILEKSGYFKQNVEGKDENKENEYKQYECEICLDLLTVKGIYTCRLCYKLMCMRCYVSVRKCPFCRNNAAVFAERNRAMERFVSELTLPCKNFRLGCGEMLDKNTRKDHEMNCNYAHIVCPLFRLCCFAGDIEGLRFHSYRDHKINFFNRKEHQISVMESLFHKSSSGQHISYGVMLHCYNNVFYCKLKMVDDDILFSFIYVKNNNKINNNDLSSIIDDDSEFAVYLELVNVDTNELRTGIVPLTEGLDIKNQIKLSVMGGLIGENSLKGDVEVSLSIKCLNEVL